MIAAGQGHVERVVSRVPRFDRKFDVPEYEDEECCQRSDRTLQYVDPQEIGMNLMSLVDREMGGGIEVGRGCMSLGSEKLRTITRRRAGICMEAQGGGIARARLLLLAGSNDGRLLARATPLRGLPHVIPHCPSGK